MTDDDDPAEADTGPVDVLTLVAQAQAVALASAPVQWARTADMLRRCDRREAYTIADRIVRELAAAYPGVTGTDDPAWDATDAALPSWWRGHDHGTHGAVARIRDALAGRELGPAWLGDAELDDVVRRVEALVRRDRSR